MERLRDSLEDLIVQTSTNLAPDVRRALAAARAREAPGSRSALALDTIALNVDMACDRCGPICQDTGLPFFHVKAPVGVDELEFSEAVAEAVAAATRAGTLRPNSVDSLTGRNTGDNLGPGTPVVHFEQWLSDEIEVRLILKGGGCENKGAQYSLPCELPVLGRADRDLEGVRKCLLHAVHQAQGQGCSVGVLGVAIGGDRASGYQLAKEQLFRPLDDTSRDPILAALEAEVVEKADTLGIGTMGFGGAVTLVGCKIGAYNRLPASFFVTVSYDCWALRRMGAVLDAKTGALRRWLYREGPAHRMAAEAGLPLTGREIRLTTPLSEEEVLRLRVGDVVLLSGVLHTGRDALHHYLMSHDAPVSLRGAALYHCGPVALEKDGRWTITAAGPTTSIREEPYEAHVIRTLGVRAVIGKGGMGARTLAALREHGAVYLSAIGGAAQYYAACIEGVEGADLLELGVPEAMWHLRVREFPAIVTMDATGRSLHADVERASEEALAELAVPAAR
ncbi:MAG: fumarate hydratase [Acidobacteria bacterium]|nr:fumarate hydratase [Acidobacteriota bacterium]